MKNFIYFIVFAMFISSCQEIVEVKLNNSDPRLVVDGLVTNAPGPYFINLTLVGSFYDKGPTPRVTNATVTISDDAGNSEILVATDNKTGTYQTTNLLGAVGRTYTLNILYNGRQYQGSSILLPVTAIDTLKVSEEYEKQTPFKNAGYYVYLSAKEPRGVENFYRWRVYKNDTIFNGKFDLLFSDDVALKEEIIDWELPFAFKNKDTVRVEMYSITKEYNKFLIGYFNALTNDGGLFSPPPANPSTNMDNGAIGFFVTSAVSSKTVVIDRE